MSKTTSYIISYNKKTEVFTLTSFENELTINSEHKKYEWLKGQEAGRIVKISEKEDGILLEIITIYTKALSQRKRL